MSENSETGFQAINPFLHPDSTLRRRNLPHLQAPRATYFVTFRCRKSLTLTPEARDVVMASIAGCDGPLIDLDAAVVMPDHVHIIFRIARQMSLGSVLRRIKGPSALKLNRMAHRSDAVWMDESFDHVIRHETEWRDKLEYIRNNPVKRGLIREPQQYRWLFVRKITG